MEKMTKSEAVWNIYKVINSGIISEELEDELRATAHYIETDEWEEEEPEQKCRVCGCTNDFACPGGCYWVEEDLCSKCAKDTIQN